MTNGALPVMIGRLRRQSGCTLTDAQLLEDFVTRRDEKAFEVLVWRHGAMVLGVCRRVLRDAHEAEDAFQATFLVFARKAGSVGKREAVGGWLCKVAYRVALRVRARAARRGACAEPAEDLPARETDDHLWRDLRSVLDEEIDRLPEKYRVPFVLCYLEGHTNEEAAAQLGCPKGTILSRLARGRERLRSRLTRRGVALSTAWLVAALSQKATAALPPALVSPTVEAATLFAAGKAVSGLVSASVAALTEGVLHTMLLTKLKVAAVALLALTVLGMGVVSYPAPAGPPEPTRGQDARRGEERKPDERPAPPDRGGREGRRGPTFSGNITAISDDGKSLSVESGRRGEEAKKFDFTINDKTVVEFGGVLKELGLKLKVGDSASVWLKDGSKDVERVEAFRTPHLAGKIRAVAGDGKSLTVEVPSQARGEGPKQIEIKITDKTKFGAARGEDDGKPKVGYTAQVWLQEGSNDTAAAVQSSPPRPDLGGVVTAVSADGKVLTVESKGRSGEPIKTEVKLTETTKVEFPGVEKAEEKKLGAGYGVRVWLREGSDEAVVVHAVTPQALIQQRTPDLTGTVASLSADGKVLTVEHGGRGEEPKKTEIKLTDKTSVVFVRIEKEEERKLAAGYHVTVWLQEGSKDTAAVVQATKPAERGR
jgi:RNA polymerase sigma factor (sigma-70 family)